MSFPAARSSMTAIFPVTGACTDEMHDPTQEGTIPIEPEPAEETALQIDTLVRKRSMERSPSGTPPTRNYTKLSRLAKDFEDTESDTRVSGYTALDIEDFERGSTCTPEPSPAAWDQFVEHKKRVFQEALEIQSRKKFLLSQSDQYKEYLEILQNPSVDPKIIDEMCMSCGLPSTTPFERIIETVQKKRRDNEIRLDATQQELDAARDEFQENLLPYSTTDDELTATDREHISENFSATTLSLSIQVVRLTDALREIKNAPRSSTSLTKILQENALRPTLSRQCAIEQLEEEVEIVRKMLRFLRAVKH